MNTFLLIEPDCCSLLTWKKKRKKIIKSPLVARYQWGENETHINKRHVEVKYLWKLQINNKPPLVFNGTVTLLVKPRPNREQALTNLETLILMVLYKSKLLPFPTMLYCARHHPTGVTWDTRLPDFLSTIKPANNVAGACQDCRRSRSLGPASLLQSAVLLMVHWGERRVL